MKRKVSDEQERAAEKLRRLYPGKLIGFGRDKNGEYIAVKNVPESEQMNINFNGIPVVYK